MVYYHPGTIIEVLSPSSKEIKSADRTTQALVEMWDGNMITLLVDAKIANSVKSGDVVIVDYHPVSVKFPRPKMIATKIVSGKKSENILKSYKNYLKKRPKPKPTEEAPKQVDSRYIG